MIYFDNAATTIPKPPVVLDAVLDAACNFGNPSRGAYGASLKALRCMLDARMAVADLFGASDPMQVAFTQNATAALNMAIGGIKGHIVTTAAEHNSVLRPLYRRGNFSVAPLNELGRLELESIESAIKNDTEAVVITHASNLTGNVFDIESVAKICKKRGLRLIVDAAQTAGMLSLNMKKTGITALCITGHKSLYAPQGIGAIILDKDFLPPAICVGGSGSDSFSTAHPNQMPDALEAGTQNMPAIAGLLAGIGYIKRRDDIFSAANLLSRRFASELKNHDRITLYGDIDAPLRLPIVSINIDKIDGSELAAQLFENHDIAVRAGAHCAPLMHKTLGTQKTGVVRFSFSHLNTDSELDTAISAIKQTLKKSRTNQGATKPCLS